MEHILLEMPGKRSHYEMRKVCYRRKSGMLKVSKFWTHVVSFLAKLAAANKIKKHILPIFLTSFFHSAYLSISIYLEYTYIHVYSIHVVYPCNSHGFHINGLRVNGFSVGSKGFPADIYETLNSVWKVQFPKDPDPSRKIVGLMVPISSPQ